MSRPSPNESLPSPDVLISAPKPDFSLNGHCLPPSHHLSSHPRAERLGAASREVTEAESRAAAAATEAAAARQQQQQVEQRRGEAIQLVEQVQQGERKTRQALSEAQVRALCQVMCNFLDYQSCSQSHVYGSKPHQGTRDPMGSWGWGP